MPQPTTHELTKPEFPLAEKVWTQYRGQKADPKNERIFGVFVNGTLVATARCTRYPGGLEMDCVFTLDEFRGHGYARDAVQALIDACGKETIYIHSTLVLRTFYKTFGWVPIGEKEMPQSIRDRFIFCFGDMEGCNAIPMVRKGT